MFAYAEEAYLVTKNKITKLDKIEIDKYKKVYVHLRFPKLIEEI